jgi:N-acetylmuramoyl-L-alanine amidase
LKLRPQAQWIPLALLALCLALWIAPGAHPQAEKHLTIFAPATVYSVPLASYDGQDYVGLADVLEPLGNVEARADGKKWKLRFTFAGGHDVSAEFQEGKDKGKVRGQDVQLSGNFHLENGRGYVPVHGIGTLLPLFAGLPTEFHDNSLRLLLGNVAIRLTQEMQKGAAPKLVLSFSAPVNPMVATEPGKLRLTFRREALVGTASENVQTGDSTITGTTFNDSTGTAQITVAGTVPLSAAFADGGKTILITPVPTATAPTEAAKTVPPVATPTPTTPAAPAPATPAAPRFLVVIDPAHGGDERGAAITDTLKEKDVNFAIARRLLHELQNRGINAALLRTGDTTLGLDDRAIATNSAHPALYICVHSANLGTGARIFTALMPPSAPVTARKFLPWSQAQAPYLDLSSQFAGSISAELGNRQISVTALPAPLRPLRNIAAPAIAIEIAPPDDDPDNINDADYQQNIAAAVANGIAAMKPKLQGAK